MDTLLEKNLLDESLEDIYSKYYIGKLDKDEFDDVIALDPTFSSEQDKLGSYGKWLLTLAIKNGTESLLQESEEVTDQLGIFDEHKRSYDVNDRDIMRCKSLQDLIEVNHKYEAEEASNEMIKANNIEGLRILGNTSNWEIYNPQTYEAAKYIRGDNAVWCTGRINDPSYFNSYMRRNLDLVVFINKQNRDVKYQAAISRDTFRVQEFADARNQHYLPFTDFIDSNPELLTPLRSVYPQFVNNLARRIDLKNRLKNNISNNILTLDSEVMNEIRLLSREGVEVNTLFSRDIKCYAFCISSLDNAVIRWFEDFIPYNFYNLYLDMDNIEILNENIFSYLLKLNSKIHIKKTAKLKIHKWMISLLKNKINWY